MSCRFQIRDVFYIILHPASALLSEGTRFNILSWKSDTIWSCVHQFTYNKFTSTVRSMIVISMKFHIYVNGDNCTDSLCKSLLNTIGNLKINMSFCVLNVCLSPRPPPTQYQGLLRPHQPHLQAQRQVLKK